ncbi:transglycosylase SLT domain-containing protein [Novosphingobium beihaiensis]|uniref:Transglycosylase SLT domain-containing protein n=1 Tax=Novosphingobium beihaiensis TaxID=2930389 RepID=A0ABT0BP51_9SPHN|nr:transglycosylase SLT domain-containing protein [Novosphingobium beihaiensis]MCJ2186827.1 transglycosylase SLT domain-containing protein [Novosphingobium beihaiensis]
MSEGQVFNGIGGAAAAGGAQTRAAIARASEKTGIDFQYLLAQAKLESSLNPDARASTSSAAGLYQFTQGTWLETLGRHGTEHGMAWVNDVIQGGRITDPGARSQVMGLRYNAGLSSMMAAELASDNKAELTTQLGREPDATELYMAHFLGINGASKFLSALKTDPSQSAAAILPKAAAANRAIFYSGGSPRSVGGMMELMRGKVANAMEGGDASYWASVSPAQSVPATPGVQAASNGAAAQSGSGWQPPMGQIAREFHAGLGSAPQAPKIATRSMAETLQGAFGNSPGAVPAQVRDAYAKLARFNL